MLFCRPSQNHGGRLWRAHTSTSSTRCTFLLRNSKSSSIFTLPRQQLPAHCPRSKVRVQQLPSLHFRNTLNMHPRLLACCTQAPRTLLPHPLKAAATSPIATRNPHPRAPQAAPAQPSAISIAFRRSSHGNRHFKSCATWAQDVRASHFIIYQFLCTGVWGGCRATILRWSFAVRIDHFL